MASRIITFLLISAAYFESLADANEKIRLKLTTAECYEMVRLATAGDEMDMVDLLVNQGCSVNRPPGSTSKENTPLHIAVVNGNLELVKKLMVDYGGDVLARGIPALELVQKKCATCKYLLKHD
ncbi:hypothetical protein JTE90_004100 [Oedothorax gibbosus]|uniref:Ankyrin repeat protein n=1 Tax=Oedothorax gibbosus TaxID=931172 RepID=A0AAV6V1A9_9ARAC|nr:hypothetical protein JTE90_004100 [Oedothorax gibbosus]